jgi:hypothetical protein
VLQFTFTIIHVDNLFTLRATIHFASLFTLRAIMMMCIDKQTYTVSYRFPNNFALFRDPRGSGGVSAVWITEFSEEADVKDTVVRGFRFGKKEPSYEDKYFSMASLHSYRVSSIETSPSEFHVSFLIGKASCLFLGTDENMEPSAQPKVKLMNSEESYKVPNPKHHFLFELLDHCIDYTEIEPKVPVVIQVDYAGTSDVNRSKEPPKVVARDSHESSESDQEQSTARKVLRKRRRKKV